MKYIKRILIGMFVLILLVAAFVFILIRFYKKEMAVILADMLKSEYNLNLKVEETDVSFLSNWPHASVELKNIYLASDLYPDTTKPILKAESISMSFDLASLFKKKFIVNSVSIKNADVKLIKDISGSKNFDFSAKKDTVKKHSKNSSLVFEIKKISIRNTQFNFINEDKKQNIDIHFSNNYISLKPARDGLIASLKGEIKVGGLLLNPRKGAYLLNTVVKTDLDFSVYFRSKMIVVHPTSFLTIDKHRYDVNSFIELGDVKRLMLRIESKNVNYEQGAALLNAKIQQVLHNFSVARPFDLKALVIAKIDIKEDPILILNFDVRDNDVTIGNSRIPYSHVSLHGTIVSLDSTRSRGEDEKATIKFTGIKGNIYDFPFTGSVNLVNFTDPVLKIDARMLVDARKIKFKFAENFILKGSCVARVSYSGPASKLNSREFLGKAMHLNANLLFDNFSYQEKSNPYTYIVKGKANVNNRDLKFDRLLLKMDAGEAVLTGKAEGFVQYVLGYGNSLKINLNAKSDYLNLNPYIMPGTAAAPVYAGDQDDSKKTTAGYKQSVQDAGENNFEFNAVLFAKKLIVRKVEAQNAGIELSHKNKLLNIKSVKANICDGKVFMKGAIADLHKMSGEMDMEDININRLFDEFENFGQKKVESKHLKGIVTMHASFKTELDNNMEIIGESFNGDVKLRLKDGHLLNFEPVQSMSNFIFRNRNFDNVTFSELNERFKIRGYEMDIQELEIGSNILNLYVTGIYNFRENSNINILIPWSNLKKRGKNYIPKNSGETAENSRGLKLNYSGPTSNMKLSLGHKDVAGKN